MPASHCERLREPAESSGQPTVSTISLADVETNEVRRVIKAWRHWCGFSSLPPSDRLMPRDLGPALGHVSVARVRGEDYEFMIIGDVHVRAYGHSFQGRMLSEVLALTPRFGRQLKASYDFVRNTRRPLGFRGMISHDVPGTQFNGFETVYLPFGTQSAGVDHILNAAVYA
ncbi:MAG TPA: hypothetical protein VIM02_00700 [Rhizomicrobium sp.]